ncbi:MAG: hypothetical protein AAB289_16665 [Chloroflexota bacterium]
MAATYPIMRRRQVSPRAARLGAFASPGALGDRSEVLACLAFGLLLATVVLVFGLLIAIGPAAGGPLR